ncbi:MAG: transglycosylase SLT domain-containing protein [Myxococcales bacterium]|nr:transglycosylase SLT domain-containing protein [Myxococcales bacterium]
MRMTRVVILVANLAVPHAARGQAGEDETARLLARALEERIAVWGTRGGRILHARHCRAASEGCRARLALFARWIAGAARAHGVDPWLLAAIAVRESGLDPFAVGRDGEHGIVQLHPRGVGRGVRFVASERYRARCSRAAGACQQEVLDVGARHLADAIAGCGGDPVAGLGAYNSGRCGPTRYVVRVLLERRRLRALVGLDPGDEPPIPDRRDLERHAARRRPPVGRVAVARAPRVDVVGAHAARVAP